VDGRSFQCTRNLHAALSGPVLQHHVRIIWVDAICINQTDMTERNHQFAEMRYIYQEAQSVVTFLGDSFDGLDILVDFMP
jgi:hypothetical protein